MTRFPPGASKTACQQAGSGTEGERTGVGATLQTVPETTDEQLLAEAVREGSDGLAFTALVRRHQDRVWRLSYRLMGNVEDAEDAAQEVFVRLFANRDRFAGKSKFTTWLHAITVRTCLTLRRGRGRRRRRENTFDPDRLEASSGRTGRSPDAEIDARNMLEILDEEDRALMILKYAENYTIDDLSEMFGLSSSACKMRLSRARQKIRRYHGETDEGP